MVDVFALTHPLRLRYSVNVKPGNPVSAVSCASLENILCHSMRKKIRQHTENGQPTAPVCRDHLVCVQTSQTLLPEDA